jgi:hypothetical protein
LQKLILSRDYSLPAGTVALAGGGDTIEVAPATVELAKFKVTIPNDAPPGKRLPVNIKAVDSIGGTVGGITVYFDVKP